MKTILYLCSLILAFTSAFAQNVGIVRANYFSSYFDSTLNTTIQVLDSSTIRLGSLNPATGSVSNVGNVQYNSGINLTGATINPYLNHYYIGSGLNLLTFDISSGAIVNNVPITGTLQSGAFQNYRFNPSDSVVYGMFPQNFYSTYFDSLSMSPITVLDSARIRFASIDPTTGQYSLIGNTRFKTIYTLAGNSIDPFQMLYYYSEVDTLVGIDVYTGNKFSEVPIQLPPNAIFENLSYSCADTSIYGITRQNFISTVYDSLFMDSTYTVDSTTFRLSKINPNTGVVTFLSPANIGVGGNLTGGSFIDPSTMTYYFNHGNSIVGVSMQSGLITSNVLKTYQGQGFSLDMMRSTLNCWGAARVRSNAITGLTEDNLEADNFLVYPNPAQSEITVQSQSSVNTIELIDGSGKVIIVTENKTISVAEFSPGLYLLKLTTDEGKVYTRKFMKD